MMIPVVKKNGPGGVLRPPARRTPGTRPVVPEPGAGQNEVTFQTADGAEFSARLTHLTRHVATFEAVNLAATWRTSEVLSHFKITADTRVVYFGRAVISQMLHTGESLLCEAKLDDLGSETAFFLPPTETTTDRQDAYEVFFQSWQKEYRLAPEFKVLVADVQSYLTGVRHWLESLEFGLKDSPELAAQEQAILDSVAPKIIEAFNHQHERFEEMLYELPREALGAHQEFVRRHWHKLFLGSPFAHRTYHKPLGHAGDYEMMNMIHRNQPEGRSLYEKLIHLLLVSQWPARSVRNRITHLGENILRETARIARGEGTAHILNVGCGPAWEVQDFLAKTHLCNRAEFTLIDFNEETLTHASQRLVETKRKHGRHTTIRTSQISVYQLLKRTQQHATGPTKKFDLIYCAGLFDYLAPETSRALMELWYEWLAPGGLMLIANMNDTKPFRHFIEFILDWQLIYRDPEEIMALVPDACREHTRVIAEPTAVNLFLHIRKPD